MNTALVDGSRIRLYGCAVSALRRDTRWLDAELCRGGLQLAISPRPFEHHAGNGMGSQKAISSETVDAQIVLHVRLPGATLGQHWGNKSGCLAVFGNVASCCMT